MAKRTIQSMVLATRSLLQDTRTTRYSDAEVLEGFNQALAIIRKNRPDAYTTTFGSERYDYAPEEMNAVFPLDETFIPAVISYMTAWCELREDQYTAEGRAAALIQRFGANLNGLGV